METELYAFVRPRRGHRQERREIPRKDGHAAEGRRCAFSLIPAFSAEQHPSKRQNNDDGVNRGDVPVLVAQKAIFSVAKLSTSSPSSFLFSPSSRVGYVEGGSARHSVRYARGDGGNEKRASSTTKKFSCIAHPQAVHGATQRSQRSQRSPGNHHAKRE